MKSKKLNLSDFRVKSFITDLNGSNAQTVKGGWHMTETTAGDPQNDPDSGSDHTGASYVPCDTAWCGTAGICL